MELIQVDKTKKESKSMGYQYSELVMVPPHGAKVTNNNNSLCQKLGTLTLTNAHKRQYVKRESSNFKIRIRDVLGDATAILAVILGVWAAAWAGCAVSDACYAAQGGLF